MYSIVEYSDIHSNDWSISNLNLPLNDRTIDLHPIRLSHGVSRGGQEKSGELRRR